MAVMTIKRYSSVCSPIGAGPHCQTGCRHPDVGFSMNMLPTLPIFWGAPDTTLSACNIKLITQQQDMCYYIMG